MRKFNRRDALFLALAFASVVVAVRSSTDPLPGWFQGTHLGQWLLQFRAVSQNIHDVAMGVFVSFVFYFLVVWLPERDKRKRVRRNLLIQYGYFKERCIRIFLSTVGVHDSDTVDDLKNQVQFRKLFKAPFVPGQDRWDGVANNINTDAIKTLGMECELLIAEIRYSLTVIDVDNEQAFAALRQLADGLYRTRSYSPEYDISILLKPFWEIFAGWSWVDGYFDEDGIAGAINAL